MRTAIQSIRINKPAVRHEFADLQALEIAGVRFQGNVLQVIETLTESEPVPVPDTKVEKTVQEAAATLRAVRAAVAFTQVSYANITAKRDRLAQVKGRRVQPLDGANEAASAADSYTELLEALEPQLLQLLRRLEPRRPTPSSMLSLEPDPVDPLPQITPGSANATRAQVDELMRAYVAEMAPRFFELKRTLMILQGSTATWPASADRQLHADLARFVSRLMAGVDPLSQGAGRPDS